MKKILIFAILTILTSLNASAAELNALVTDNQITIEKTQDMSDSVIAVCYDGNGRLILAQRIDSSDGMYKMDIAEGCEKIRVYDLGKESYDVNQATPAPEATPSPKPTLHPAYEKEADARSAFAVVEKVVNTVNADNEDVYAVTCLYQGQKITVEVAADVEIKSAPGVFSDLKGMDASALKAGDAIYYETNLSGKKVKAIDLIFRPTNVFEESSFYNCFTGALWSVAQYGAKMPSSRYVYAFGVIAQKYDTSMTLYSHSGLAEDAIDIDFTDDTVTYICNMEGKPELEVSRVSGITKTRIPKSATDDDDNITYTDDYSYSLALVRLVDDTAADIVVYQNMEF